MLETVQAPISKGFLRQWLETPCSFAINIQHSSGETLQLQHDKYMIPEIDVLFFASPEDFRGTVEIGGIYDQRTSSFRFMRNQLAAVVNGFSKTEIHTGADTSEGVYEKIKQYAKKAIEEKGYQFKQPGDADHVESLRNARSALSAMAKYAEVLASKGEQSAVQDIRDLAWRMIYFWYDPVYLVYERGLEKVERQYMEQFDQAVANSSVPGHTASFSSEDAKAIFRGLALHAEETTDNEDALSVWKCCRLAKRLGEDYPEEKELFFGNFIPNYNDQPPEEAPQTMDKSEQDSQKGEMTLA